MKKRIKIFSLVFLLLLIGLLVYVFIAFLPIMTGMVAKTMCSCVYVLQRDPASVEQKEMAVFPGLSRAEVQFDNVDSSVTASLLGRKSEAVFRKGLGCTLIAERSAEALRKQKFELASPSLIRQDSLPWPGGDKLSGSLMEGVNYQQIRNAIDSAFIDIDPDRPIYTHAVVVVYDGQVIAEKYANGFSKDSKMMGWSMTKSITNALVGILVKEGKLKLEQPAPVIEWQTDERRKITLNNLLQASSGLEWSETYFLPGDFHNMYIHSDDKGGYAASKEMKYPANEHFEYSSGTTNILSKIIRQTVGDADYYRFPYQRLFYKIGMYHTLLEPDASGTFVGSSYGYATARDWARFGLLILNDGVWMGERILPEGWVTYSSTPAPSAKMREYGAQWWLNTGEKGNPQHCKYPGLPAETMVADGFEHQYVAIIPSKKLVIVRLGITHNSNFNLAGLVNGVIRGLP